MDDSKFAELLRLVGQHEKMVYEAVKAGRVSQLPHESQLFAKAMQEHMHLKHVHNALEFADLREGEPYEITVGGEPVNPLAHLTAHAAVKGQVEQDPFVRAAFKKMVSTGTPTHHAEHILGTALRNRVGNRPCRRGWKRYQEVTENVHPQTSKTHSGCDLSQEINSTIHG
jgi:hypothetical protein